MKFFSVLFILFALSLEASIFQAHKVKADPLEPAIPTFSLKLSHDAPKTEYALQVKYLSGHENTLHRSLRIGQHGTLLDHHNNPFTLSLLGMGLGEPIWLSLHSKNDQFKLKLIPRPFEVQLNGYTVSLELTDKEHKVFSMEAQGFDPGEKLTIYTKAGKQKICQRISADQEGKLSSLLKHPNMKQDGGEAYLEIKGKSGSISLNYPWGRKYNLDIKEISEYEQKLLRSRST